MIKQLMSSPMKIVYVVVGMAFLLLGFIGLIFPLIPGVLFIVAAIYVLGKASTRVRAWSANSPTYMGVEKRVALLGGVGWWDRIRLGSLMALEVMVSGIDNAAARVQKVMRSRR